MLVLMTQTRSEKVNADIVGLLRARNTLLWVTTREERRVEKAIIEAAAKADFETMFWDCAAGLQTSLEERIAGTQDPQAALEFVRNTKLRRVYVMRDLHAWKDPMTLRTLRNLARDLQGQRRAEARTIIVLTPVSEIPVELAGCAIAIDYPLPERPEIARFLDEIISKVPAEIAKGEIFIGTRDQAIDAAVGLTAEEALTCYSKSLVTSKRIDPALIAGDKKRVIERERVLTWTDPDPRGLDAVGGFDRLKTWLVQRQAGFSQRAREFGLPAPKGVLLLGPPGVGKSLTARTVATAWGMPLLRLDLGALKSKYVGDSEGNIRKALAVAEAVAPCVTGETLVTLASGIQRTIEDLWCEGEDGLQVACWDDQRLIRTTTRVSAITKRSAPVFGIKAANGFALNATAEHRHYVLRGDMPEWVETSELRPGDMLGVPLTVYEGDASLTNCVPAGLREYARPDGSVELRRGGGGYRDSVVPRLPSEWTPSLAWLMGAVEGDGYMSRNSGSIGFINTNEKLLDAFEKAFAESFGKPTTRYEMSRNEAELDGLSENPQYQRCWTTKIGCKIAVDFLTAARERILAAPPDVRAAFLAGWIDADGCIRPDKINLTVKDPVRGAERRLLARALVQSLGVTPSKFDSRQMDITGKRAVDLAVRIAPFLVAKQDKARAVRSGIASFDRGMGFAAGRLLQNRRDTAGVSHASIGVSTNVTWRYERGDAPISERHLEIYVHAFGSEAGDLKTLLQTQCRWVEVTSIAPIGEREVFDLVCIGDSTRSFIANGLITHNCVVWVDEIEKSLVGSTGYAGDGGVASDQLGTLLSWMQERQGSVFVIATANQVTDLPPEFLRKGRFDELFFLDLPTAQERADVLRAALRQHGRDPIGLAEDGDDGLEAFVRATQGFTGAEIAAIVPDALFVAFADGERAISMADLIAAARSVVPLSKTAADKLDKLREWAKGRARFASTPEVADASNHRIANLDL